MSLHFHVYKVDNPYSVTFLIGCLYLRGLWVGVTSRTDAKKICVLKEIGLHAQTALICLGLGVNIIGETCMII